jgi:phage terminase large subunit-like protein
MRRFARERSLMEFLATLPPPTRQYLHEAFIGNGGAHQRAPDEAAAWHTWLILGGRGAGKTRAGAEWVNGMAGGLLGIAERRAMRIALVGETLADVRDVMVHGPSGLVATAPWAERPRWQPSLRRLEWPSGAVAHAFSAEDPDSLRGPRFEAA